MSRYDGASWRTYTTADGLANNNVNAILQDRGGNLWFATGGWGVSRFDGSGWGSLFITDGLASGYVRAVHPDRHGHLWFGTASGLNEYDGSTWHTYFDGTRVNSITEDHLGSLWVTTESAGLKHYDGVSWQTYTTADGLASNFVRAVLEDHKGNLWFGTQAGVTRYDGANWQTYTMADGLADSVVLSIAEDSVGALWFGTWSAVSRFDGASWRTYTTADGLAKNRVYSILADRNGDLWFGTYGDGVSRYDGASWRTYTTADGLAGDYVSAMLEDRDGDLWFATNAGVSRYDRVNWGTYDTAQGLSGNYLLSIAEDDHGTIWFGTNGHGANWHEPDRIPPQAGVWPWPPRLSTGTSLIITFAAGFKEASGVSFSYSFDGSAWSAWSALDFYEATNLSDGEHAFEVTARDLIGNVDPTPAVCRFEIDATPPAPMITFPAPGEAVRDSVMIRGTATDLRFKKYLLELRSLPGSVVLDTLAGSVSPVADGALCGWNTLSLADGDYELRLSVTDTLGLTGTALLRVVVDNYAPWAYETAPATVSVTSGGDVYTTNKDVHLYFPPHAFGQDTQVGIVTLGDSDVPDTLASGAQWALIGYEISWGGAVLEKPATLTLSYSTPLGGEELAPPVPRTLTVCFSGADSVWRHLGGTVDGSAQQISLPIIEPGRYAIYLESTGVPGPSTLSDLAVTPRAFSPGGGFASQEAAISFTLGRPGPVTVKVYNRAGRLVREVASGQQMNAGANLVHWDGRDSDSNLAEDGLYLVVVEALGKKQTKTLAVVR